MSRIDYCPKRLMPFIVLLSFVFVGINTALAVQPDEVLQDPVLEKRARVISSELRCLMCQNESIDDSNAELAKDLRILVRERLQLGETDDAVKTYLVDRYGEFVLLKPVFSARTILLWFSPLLVLLAGALGLFLKIRQKKAIPAILPLSDEEQQELQKLLNQ